MDGKAIQTDLPIFETNMVFQGLCRVYSHDAARELREKVEAVMSRFESARGQFLGPSIWTVQEIQGRALYLLDRYDELPHQALIIGAVRYFLSHIDSIPDFEPIIGLDDDVYVMNYVLKELGLESMLL